jgi:hypothetical protein
MQTIGRISSKLLEDNLYVLIACVAISFLGAYLVLQPVIGGADSEYRVFFVGAWAIILCPLTIGAFLTLILLSRAGTKSSPA